MGKTITKVIRVDNDTKKLMNEFYKDIGLYQYCINVDICPVLYFINKERDKFYE